MPLYRNGDCYSLFEQGPCSDGEWFVLNSAINGTLLPYAHCEKTLSCDVFTMTADYEGKKLCFFYSQVVLTALGLFPDHDLRFFNHI